MNKPIQTYKDLLAEKQRLKLILAGQRQVITEDINEIKAQFGPALNSLSSISKIISGDPSNLLLNGGANGIIDLVLKKLVLARAGWLSRLVIPFFVKNYSSHFLAENKDKFLKKIFSWIGHKKGKVI